MVDQTGCGIILCTVILCESLVKKTSNNDDNIMKEHDFAYLTIQACNVHARLDLHSGLLGFFHFCRLAEMKG